ETTAVLGNVRWARELRRDAFMTWLDAGAGRFYRSNVSLKRSLLERAGGFDEQRFPLVYADIDLGLRLGELGFRSVYNPKARAERPPLCAASGRRRGHPPAEVAEQLAQQGAFPDEHAR